MEVAMSVKHLASGDDGVRQRRVFDLLRAKQREELGLMVLGVIREEVTEKGAGVGRATIETNVECV